MATVEVIEIKPVDPPKEYLIRVSQDEMNLLAALLGSISGYDGVGGWKELSGQLYSNFVYHSTTQMRGVDILDVTPSYRSTPRIKRQK